MKKGLVLFIILTASASSFAQFVNTAWVYGNTKCAAQTDCPNGKRISCQTVALNYGYAPAVPNNLCRTRVVPGQFIQCQGYSDRPNAFGQIQFVPTNIPVSCF